MKNPVIIFGASSLGKSALEIFQKNHIVVYGFLDDDAALHGHECNHIPVMGSTEDVHYLSLIGKKCNAFVAVAHIQARKFLIKLLHTQCGVTPINTIHPTADMAKSACVGHGNLLNAGVLLGPDVSLGNHCIVQTRVIVEPNTVIEDFVQIGSGSIINEGVNVGKNTFIGSGVTVAPGISIGQDASIGTGAVVLNHVKAKETVLGNPAKLVKR